MCGYLLGVWGMRDRGGGGAIGVKIGFLGGAAWGPCVGLRGRSQDFGTGNEEMKLGGQSEIMDDSMGERWKKWKDMGEKDHVSYLACPRARRLLLMTASLGPAPPVLDRQRRGK